LFLLILLPFIDLNLTTEEFGSISVFDFISYLVLFFTLEDFFYFSRKNNVYYFLFLALTGLLFIGSIKSEFIGNSLFNFFKFLSVFIYSKMLIDECLKDLSFIKLVIKFLKLSCVFSLVFLLIQLIIGTNFTFYPNLNLNIYIGLGSDTLRYPSYFQDPQKYAQYLSMLGFLFLMNTETKPKPGILNIMFFILVVLAIFLTGGRAAFLGLCIGLLIVLFSNKSKIWIIAVFVCLFGYFIIKYFSAYFSLFNRTEDYITSYDLRNEIWKENLQIFFANPLLGIGIGNHHNYIVNHSDVGYYLIDNEIVFYGTENGYLQILIEFGLLGFLFAFFLILTPIISAFRSYLHSRNFNIIFLIASVISWMIAFTFVDSLSDKRILVVLVTLLCLLIVSKISPKAIHV
jgi:O-antigen ligase